MATSSPSASPSGPPSTNSPTSLTSTSPPPARQKTLKPGKRFGEIESVKATSELFSAVSGEVTAINTTLKDDPSLVNQDPYGKGWMIKVKAPGANISALMSAEQYSSQHGG